jgi:hypothetical protein
MLFITHLFDIIQNSFLVAICFEYLYFINTTTPKTPLITTNSAIKEADQTRHHRIVLFGLLIS